MPETQTSKIPLNIQELKKIKQAKKEAKKKLSQSLPEEPSLSVIERPFVDMPNRKELKERLGEIRVMTFNILAQGLIKRELFPDSGHVLKWKSRRTMIVDEIKLYNPDILTIQELDNFEQFYKDALFKLGYETKYTKYSTKKHGCGIAYRRNKFNFVDFDTIDYDADTSCSPSRLTGNVGQLLALEFVDNPKLCIIVGNTHLYWRPSANYERLRQAIIFSNRMLDFKAKLSGEKEWTPLLFGDFNTSPHEPVYPLLTKNSLDEAQIAALDKSLSLRFLEDDDDTKSSIPDATPYSASDLLKKYKTCQWHSIYSDYQKVNPYKDEEGACGEPKFTNYTVAHKGPLDYMFIEKDSQISVKRMLAMPKEDLVKPSLPNQNFGSDHLCLAVDIEL